MPHNIATLKNGFDRFFDNIKALYAAAEIEMDMQGMDIENGYHYNPSQVSSAKQLLQHFINFTVQEVDKIETDHNIPSSLATSIFSLDGEFRAYLSMYAPLDLPEDGEEDYIDQVFVPLDNISKYEKILEQCIMALGIPTVTNNQDDIAPMITEIGHDCTGIDIAPHECTLITAFGKMVRWPIQEKRLISANSNPAPISKRAPNPQSP